MNKLSLIIILLFSLSKLPLHSQETVVLNALEDIPFIQFVAEIEKAYDINFFFKEASLENINVTAAKNDTLRNVLDRAFKGSGLKYYINASNNVYILKSDKLVTQLPDYYKNSTDRLPPVNALPDAADETYVKGRTILEQHVISVGDKGASTYKTAIVDGTIKSVETGEALLGATIYLKDIEKGTTSDTDGHFKLAVKPGKYQAQFLSLGMKEFNCYLQVYSSGTLTIQLEKGIIAINEVSVTADRFDNVRATQMGFERISSKSMKEIPVVLGEKDILKVARLLPGVQSVGEGASGFNVRGSSADQNMFYINKVPVYNTSHLFGFFSSFSPDIVQDFSMYKSSIPAKYGGRMASIFDVTTRQGNKRKFSARGGISPITGHCAVEGPIVKDKSSYVLSARSTYSDWILQRLDDQDLRNSSARFYDLSGNINIEPNKNNLIKGFGYYSHDEFTLAKDNYYEYSNYGASLNWRHRFNSKLSMDLAGVFGRYNFENSDSTFEQEGFTHEFLVSHYEFTSNFSWVVRQNHSVNYGLSAIYYDLDHGMINPFGSKSERKQVDLGKERAIESAIYISDEFKVLPRLTFYVGLRYSFYSKMGPETVYQYNQAVEDNMIVDSSVYNSGDIVKSYSGPELRFTANYLTGENSSVKFSYNRIRQYMFMLSNTFAISPTDQWKLVDTHLKPLFSDQVSLGYYKDLPSSGLSLTSEVFFKNINNIVEYKDGADFVSESPIETQVLQGKQKAYGIEFMLKKPSGKFTGWLSYTYSRSMVEVNGGNYWNQINKGNPYPSNYDKPHSLNIVGNYKLGRRVSFSSNIVYGSGRPITYPIGSYYRSGYEAIQFSDRNAYRIPDYFRVDFSVNLEGNLKKKKFLHSYWMFNVYNLTGRKNAYSVFFSSEDARIKSYKMSVFGAPIFTISWNFKLGNYTSN